jgi:hypothetical protein
MCLSLASPPNRILAHPDVRTTLSKKFNDRNRRPISNDAKLGRRHDYLTIAVAESISYGRILRVRNSATPS